jgi:hypothetical protein
MSSAARRAAIGALLALGALAPPAFAQSPAAGAPVQPPAPHAASPRPVLAAPAKTTWRVLPARPDEASSPANVITPEPYAPPPVDAVYLDSLPAPPGVRVAGLAEQTVAPLNQITPDLPAQQPGQLPPGAREGVFQKFYFNGTWLPALSSEPDALGFGELDTGVVFGFPFLRRDTPLLVTPMFGVHFLDNAGDLDIPTTLYDAATEFRHLRKFGAGPWAMDVAATVGYYSDFEQSSSDALRVSGRGLAVYEATPGTKWVLGVAYLNRAGASVLPVGGVIYEPDPGIRYEAIFPRPRVAWRIDDGPPGDERWAYFGGEFGGGVWSITRPSSGELDLLSYSDWRLLVGYEHKVLGGFSRRYEAGYVFKRELDYDSATPDVSLDDTLFVRAGVAY